MYQMQHTHAHRCRTAYAYTIRTALCIHYMERWLDMKCNLFSRRCSLRSRGAHRTITLDGESAIVVLRYRGR